MFEDNFYIVTVGGEGFIRHDHLADFLHDIAIRSGRFGLTGPSVAICRDSRSLTFVLSGVCAKTAGPKAQLQQQTADGQRTLRYVEHVDSLGRHYKKDG